VLLAGDAPISAEHLPADSMRLSAPGPLQRALAGAVDAAGEAPPGLTEAELAERQRIIDELAAALGNQTRAAEALGISRRWLSTKMARYGIPRARKR
jgi:two-component system response regulator AtoC